ncbi:MAG TPA: SurA N-terminal domain-containing protein [Myxococcota bacterium]|nr:SurA N-terminal domain-containing protein [Myxococcota bacterium]
MGRVGIWVRNIALLGVLATFVFFFGPQSRNGGGGSHAAGAVATVNGEDIPRDVFEYFREMNQETFRQYSQQNVDNDRLRKLLDDQTRQSLVRRYLMAQEAESLGLSVSDATLKDDFQSNPLFQTDGKFDREIAERYLNRTGLGTREYANQHRRDLLLRNFSRYAVSPLRVSDAEVRDEILDSETKITLRVAAAGKAAFRQHVSVTPDDVKALLEKEPERVKGAYQMHVADYSKEEQIHARHMLFTGDDAEAQALKARARLEAGESFAAVAKDVSADEATRADGGDLGTFPRGRMMPAFDEAAFALEPGKPSGPVKTDRGVHLILVESHEPASQTPFEQVQDKLAHDLLVEDRAAEGARSAANRVLEKVLAGEPLAQAAEAEKLPVVVTPPFGFRDPVVPSLSGVTDVREAAFALTPEHPVPNRVFSDAESFYVVALQTRDAPSEEQIAGEMSATRERLLQRERSLTTALWFNERTKQLEAAGKLKQYELEAAR